MLFHAELGLTHGFYLQNIVHEQANEHALGLFGMFARGFEPYQSSREYNLLVCIYTYALSMSTYVHEHMYETNMFRSVGSATIACVTPPAALTMSRSLGNQSN